MVSIFKEKSTPAVIGLIFLAIVLHVFFFIKPPQVVTTPADGLLYYALAPLQQLPSIFLSLLYYVIVLVQALRINNVLNDVRMYQKNAFTASLSYILLTALLPPWNNITAALLANSFIIWLLFRIVKLYNTPQPRTLVYNIGLITGVLGLCYYPALCIIPVIFFALGITRPFRLNEWFILLLGIITPAYFYSGYLFLSSQYDVFKTFAGVFQLQKMFYADIKLTTIAFSVAGLLLVAGIIGWRANNSRLPIQVRKVWGILLVMLFLLPLSILIIKNAWPNALLLACVPGAALAGNAFLYPKRLFAALYFWLAVAAIVFISWSQFKF